MNAYEWPNGPAQCPNGPIYSCVLFLSSLSTKTNAFSQKIIIENNSETNGETEPGKTYSHTLEVSDDRHIGVREERSKETAHYCSAQ